MTRPRTIISGGQSGADIGGLIGARAAGIETGGTATAGYRTECGPQPETLRAFGLVEHASPKYAPRTRCNVQDSDGTVIFGRLTGGSKLTKDLCEELKKPYLVNPTVAELRAFVETHAIDVLNVAGNRESTNRGIAVVVANLILLAFKKGRDDGKNEKGPSRTANPSHRLARLGGRVRGRNLGDHRSARLRYLGRRAAAHAPLSGDWTGR